MELAAESADDDAQFLTNRAVRDDRAEHQASDPVPMPTARPQSSQSCQAEVITRVTRTARDQRQRGGRDPADAELLHQRGGERGGEAVDHQVEAEPRRGGGAGPAGTRSPAARPRTGGGTEGGGGDQRAHRDRGDPPGAVDGGSGGQGRGHRAMLGGAGLARSRQSAATWRASVPQQPPTSEQVREAAASRSCAGPARPGRRRRAPSASSSSAWLCVEALARSPAMRSPSRRRRRARVDVVGVGAVDRKYAGPPAASTGRDGVGQVAPPGSRPSVSTVKATPTGSPRRSRPRGDADGLLGVGQREDRDEVGAGVANAATCGRWYAAASSGVDRCAGDVPVAAGAEVAADAARRHRSASGSPSARRKADGGTVDPASAVGVVTQPGAPVGGGPPGRRLEHQPGAGPLGDVGVLVVVAVSRPRRGRPRRTGNAAKSGRSMPWWKIRSVSSPPSVTSCSGAVMTSLPRRLLRL